METRKIGEYISDRIRELGMSYSDFARRIQRSRSCINDIVQRDYIYPELLQVINKVLEFDFSIYNKPPKKDEYDQYQVIKLVFVVNINRTQEEIDKIILALENLKENEVLE